jgi:hypothetical protein
MPDENRNRQEDMTREPDKRFASELVELAEQGHFPSAVVSTLREICKIDDDAQKAREDFRRKLKELKAARCHAIDTLKLHCGLKAIPNPSTDGKDEHFLRFPRNP